MFHMHNAQRGGLWPMPKNTFFSPENDGGTPPPAATAADDTGNGAGTGSGAAQGGGDAAEKLFKQDEVNRIAGERATRARETAVKELLAKYKFEKAEDLEAFISSARQKADAELSEVERLKKQIAEGPTAEAVGELQAQADRYREEVKKHVDALVKELNIPTHFTSLLETMEPLAQLEYINKHRSALSAPPPKAPNLNGGDKGGGKGDASAAKKAVQTKYSIRRRNRS